jgi:hypothetical protein
MYTPDMDTEVAQNNVNIRQRMSAYVSIHQHTPAYVSTRQHTSVYISFCGIRAT